MDKRLMDTPASRKTRASKHCPPSNRVQAEAREGEPLHAVEPRLAGTTKPTLIGGRPLAAEHPHAAHDAGLDHADDAGLDHPAESAPAGNTLAECLALHAAIRRMRDQPGLPPGERARLAITEYRLLALRHHLECDAKLADDATVLTHPQWQAIKRCITRIVADCPRCARAISEELARHSV